MSASLVEVVHALDHRVHLRAPALAGHHAACVRLARLLAGDPGVERVSLRDRTGSIVIERQAGGLDARALAKRAAALLEKERDERGRPLAEPPSDADRGPTHIARAVAHAVAGINRDVNQALDHHADLGTLFSIALATGGIVEVLVSNELPGTTWFNLLWWALRSFMTFNVDAVESEMNTHSPNGVDRELMAE